MPEQDARVKQGLNYGLDHYEIVSHIYFAAEPTSKAKDLN